VAVAATVIQKSLIAAVRAPLAMTAQNLCPAVDNLLHHLQVTRRDLSRRKKRLAMPTKNVSQLKLLGMSFRRGA
jgi:hypothetical protein